VDSYIIVLFLVLLLQHCRCSAWHDVSAVWLHSGMRSSSTS